MNEKAQMLRSWGLFLTAYVGIGAAKRIGNPCLSEESLAYNDGLEAAQDIMQRTYRHTHMENHVNEQCGKCGLNFRNPIHKGD